MRKTIALRAAFLVLFLLVFVPVALAAPADFRDLVKAAGPAVVNINTERTAKQSPFPPGFEMFRNEPGMERFFEQFERFHGGQRSRLTRSLGSGFLISSDGYLVTNNHVVEGADVIRVAFGDADKDKSLTAEVVGTDPETDLALLKIKGSDFPFLKFGNSDKLEVGEWVVAIGNPLGLDHTVTAGILSAKGRNIQSGSYDDFLQTDASINPGNSGGPLLNTDGEVVGINTAIAQRAQGIGFAIPSSLAEKIISDLKNQGKVSRGWLGVTIQAVDAPTAKALGMKEPSGVLIGDVLSDQPAAKAGIKPGDVILSVEGKTITDTEHLLRVVAALPPGKDAKLTVWRDGKELALMVRPTERSGAQASADTPESTQKAGAKLGVNVRPLTSEEAKDARVSGGSGLMIVGLDENGPAAGAGLRPGDVIVAANRKVVASVPELTKIVDATAKEKGVLLLHISRDGRMFFSTVDFANADKKE